MHFAQDFYPLHRVSQTSSVKSLPFLSKQRFGFFMITHASCHDIIFATQYHACIDYVTFMHLVCVVMVPEKME